MMNDNMKKVVKALRSGEYSQTQETLQDENGYCCLGVMCAVFEKETGRALKRKGATAYIYGGDLDAQKGVQEWVGLSSEEGDSEDNTSLIQLNDCNGYTFSQIADFIEREPEGLLV